MQIERCDQIGKHRRAPAEVCERGVRGVARVAIVFAPLLACLVIIRNAVAGAFQLVGIDGGPVLGQGGTVEAGHEEGFYI